MDENPARRSRARGGVRGRATRARHPERPCLNCGDPAPGEYCPSCGQRKVDVLVSVRAMVTDVLEDELLLNRRLPTTLFNLFFRPGFLTVEHVNGRIVRYVRPFKLYLVSSVVFFLLLSFFGFRMLARADFGSATAAVNVQGATQGDVASLDSALVALDSIAADPTTPAGTRVGLAGARAVLERQRAEALGDTLASDTAAAAAAPRERTRTLGEVLRSEENDIEISAKTGVAAVDSAIARRVSMLMEMTPRQAVERLVGDFLNFIPTMMFVLLPFFALVLKLLYVRRGRYYAEHFVFLLHVHSFVYLLFALMLVIRGVLTLPWWLVALFLGWTTVYFFRALKRVYAQDWLRTFVKGWLIGWVYFIVLTASLPLALVVSFFFL